MNKRFYLFSVSVLISLLCFSQQATDQQLIGKFFGRTPCQELARLLHQSTTPECIKIKWALTLYRSSGNSQEGTFILEGFTFKGERKLTGKWLMQKGTASDPDAEVFELIHNESNLMLQKIDDNLLYFLDPQKNLMVGNADFNYVLSRG